MELWPGGLLCRVGSDCEVNVLPSILVTPNMGCEMYGTDNLDNTHIIFHHLSIHNHQKLSAILLPEYEVKPFLKLSLVLFRLVIVGLDLCINY